MADGDEQDLFAIGTPFEQLEDDAPRKKPVPIHEQIVTDSRGRRRFHGAFTGGFSAGYFNTVDTKEGWTPKTFVSSRSQKATERSVQRPEDFMDEEDVGEFGIAPKRVVTTEKFLSTDKDENQRKRSAVAEESRGVHRIIQGNEILQDLIVPVKISVGVKLLTQMGWKEGQGIGPRVRRVAKKTYGCAPQPTTNKQDDEDDIYAVGLLFAPKDVQSIEFTSKDNLHGIGYSGINPKTALSSQRDWLGMDPGTDTIGIRGQGFGVGALEEDDDDIYRQDNLSNYDMHVDLKVSTTRKKNDLHGWTGPPQTSEHESFLYEWETYGTELRSRKMTEWERECEAEEFTRSAALYRPLSHTMAARFTTAKESNDTSTNDKESEPKDKSSGASKTIFGALTRQRIEWHPDRLLCKRFNIPDPYPGSGSTGVPPEVPTSQRKNSNMNETLDRQVKSIEYKPTSESDKTKTSALLTGFQAMASRTSTQDAQEPSSETSQSHQSGEQSVAENEDVIKLASMDLFKTVFADSSSDSNSEDSDNEEEEEEEAENDPSHIVKSDAQKLESKTDERLEPSKDVNTDSTPASEQVAPLGSKSAVHSTGFFGPALPSYPAAKPAGTSRDTQHHEKKDEMKLKHKKKKKRIKKKSKEIESDEGRDSDYERRKKSRKKRENKETFTESSDEDHERRSKGRKNTRPRETDSDSQNEYRTRDKHRKKKERKFKEGKKHKSKNKDKTEKHRTRTEFSLEDYVERTAENLQTGNKEEPQNVCNEKRSGKFENNSKEGKHLSRDEETRVSKDDDRSSDSQIMNKDIISKMKNIQLLKERRRMRAADFM
ncbi:hypothetical protein QZH41_013309 [Actinostola sp. cb2023]|nr:hypothetical protein QZH41_013309 [Actinostola sp. cb2023]